VFRSSRERAGAEGTECAYGNSVLPVNGKAPEEAQLDERVDPPWLVPQQRDHRQRACTLRRIVKTFCRASTNVEGLVRWMTRPR